MIQKGNNLKVSDLGCLVITQATIAALETALLKLQSGQAMAAGDTGTARTLPANWAQTRTLLDVQFFQVGGGNANAIIWYAGAP